MGARLRREAVGPLPASGRRAGEDIAEKDASYELLVDSLDERDEDVRNGVANPKIAGSAVDPAGRPRRTDVPTRAAALQRRLAAQRAALPHGV